MRLLCAACRSACCAFGAQPPRCRRQVLLPPRCQPRQRWQLLVQALLLRQPLAQKAPPAPPPPLLLLLRRRRRLHRQPPWQPPQLLLLLCCGLEVAALITLRMEA